MRLPVTGALGPSAENKAKLSVLSHCSFLTLSSSTDTLHTHKAISAFTLLFSHTLFHYWHPAHTHTHTHTHTVQSHQCFHAALFSHSPLLLTRCTHRKTVTDMMKMATHTNHRHESLFETAVTTTGIYCLLNWKNCSNHHWYLLLVKLKKLQ